jgi:hypothetical protein
MTKDCKLRDVAIQLRLLQESDLAKQTVGELASRFGYSYEQVRWSLKRLGVSRKNGRPASKVESELTMAGKNSFRLSMHGRNINPKVYEKVKAS